MRAPHRVRPPAGSGAATKSASSTAVSLAPGSASTTATDIGCASIPCAVLAASAAASPALAGAIRLPADPLFLLAAALLLLAPLLVPLSVPRPATPPPPSVAIALVPAPRHFRVPLPLSDILDPISYLRVTEVHLPGEVRLKPRRVMLCHRLSASATDVADPLLSERDGVGRMLFLELLHLVLDLVREHHFELRSFNVTFLGKLLCGSHQLVQVLRERFNLVLDGVGHRADGGLLAGAGSCLLNVRSLACDPSVRFPDLRLQEGQELPLVLCSVLLIF